MQVCLRPKPGLSVPEPGGAMLPAEGKLLELDLYWRRRLADGDVEIVHPAPTAKLSPREGAADAQRGAAK